MYVRPWDEFYKRDASGKPRVSCFRSPPVNVRNFLPRRI
jgi:hypothetical protein